MGEPVCGREVVPGLGGVAVHVGEGEGGFFGELARGGGDGLRGIFALWLATLGGPLDEAPEIDGGVDVEEVAFLPEL